MPRAKREEAVSGGTGRGTLRPVSVNTLPRFARRNPPPMTLAIDITPVADLECQVWVDAKAGALRLRAFTLADAAWLHRFFEQRAIRADLPLEELCTGAHDDLLVEILIHQIRASNGAAFTAEQLRDNIHAQPSTVAAVRALVVQLYLLSFPEKKNRITRTARLLRCKITIRWITLLLACCGCMAAAYVTCHIS